jgi:ABC-type amino acid transport substrate-binding protein
MRRALFAVSAVVCAAILVWWGGDGARQADTGDAGQGPVYRLARFPPMLIVGVIGNAMMPLEGIEADRLSGFSGDLLMQLIPHDQVRVIPRVFARRDELLKAACRGDVDIIMSVAPRSQYDHCLEYSAPYLERPTAVVARTENVEIAQNPFGAGVRVAVEQGSSLEEELAHEYPNIVLVSTPTAADALDAVLDKTVDVYVGVTYPTRELIARPRYREL